MGETALRERLLAASANDLMAEARELRDAGHGRVQSWSPKVFIPLTQLCRNLCHYCTFSQPPRKGEAAYLTREQVLDIARAGQAAGCTEALFTLGDKPELRFAAARDELERVYGEKPVVAVFGPRGAGARLPREVDDVGPEPEPEAIEVKMSDALDDDDEMDEDESAKSAAA